MESEIRIRVLGCKMGELTLVKVDKKINCWPKSTFGQSAIFCNFSMYGQSYDLYKGI